MEACSVQNPQSLLSLVQIILRGSFRLNHNAHFATAFHLLRQPEGQELLHDSQLVNHVTFFELKLSRRLTLINLIVICTSIDLLATRHLGLNLLQSLANDASNLLEAHWCSSLCTQGLQLGRICSSPRSRIIFFSFDVQAGVFGIGLAASHRLKGTMWNIAITFKLWLGTLRRGLSACSWI